MKKAFGFILLATAATAILGPMFLLYPAAYVVAIVGAALVLTGLIVAGIFLTIG